MLLPPPAHILTPKFTIAKKWGRCVALKIYLRMIEAPPTTRFTRWKDPVPPCTGAVNARHRFTCWGSNESGRYYSPPGRPWRGQGQGEGAGMGEWGGGGEGEGSAGGTGEMDRGSWLRGKEGEGEVESRRRKCHGKTRERGKEARGGKRRRGGKGEGGGGAGMKF